MELGALAQTLGDRLADYVPRLVLCQPAFAVHPAVLEAIRTHRGDTTPRTLLALATDRVQILDEVKTSLLRLRRVGVRIDMIAWLDERFLGYRVALEGERPVVEVLDEVGMVPERVSLDQLATHPDPFRAHCAVPHQPAFTERLAEVLRRT